MKIIATLLFLVSFSVAAEYRVYQYILKNNIKTANDQNNSQIVISSYDPQTFISYHGGSNLVKLDLLRTWICPGHTGHRADYCDSPYKKLNEEILKK